MMARNSVLHSKDDASLLTIRSTEVAEIKIKFELIIGLTPCTGR